MKKWHNVFFKSIGMRYETIIKNNGEGITTNFISVETVDYRLYIKTLFVDFKPVVFELRVNKNIRVFLLHTVS